MFENVNNPLQKKSFVKAMREIVAASLVTPFTLSVPTDKVEKIVKADATLLQVFTVDPANAQNTIVQATTAGVAAVNALPPDEPAAPAAEKSAPVQYEFVELDSLPESKRGGNKGDSYPFAQLTAPTPKLDPTTNLPLVVNGVQQLKYASFFVPATEKRPNPAKSLQSTAASASKRNGGAATFTARKAVDATGKITGAYIIRIK